MATNPPLLLTKRLTSFLHSNTTPALPTLLVTTPTGKLLAHASPQPVSQLRTHATVAASLLTIHTSSDLPYALGNAPDEPDADTDGETERREPVKPSTITVQLTHGTVLIRRLKCGLLFVCVGPSEASDQHFENGEAHIATSPSEVESVGGHSNASFDSAGGVAVVAMRRHAAELARWLDDKLGTLTVPDEGVGVE